MYLWQYEKLVIYYESIIPFTNYLDYTKLEVIPIRKNVEDIVQRIFSSTTVYKLTRNLAKN